MKKLLLLLFSLFSLISFAQLDREHWFAPMMDRSNQTSPYQSIYMSTDQTTPFKVEIYNNNTLGNQVLIGSVMLSKGNPQKFEFDESVRERIITKSQLDLFKPTNKGIYLQGEKPFFANLRFSVHQHAEIVTSKGNSAKGKEFYTSPAPINAYLGNVTFMTSIMATDDNTQVTITGFNPSVHFSDNVNRTQFNFTLNKGQSYIIDGEDSFGQNWTGFIGAKISATKPITVTNGNFNGQYVSTSSSSTDILMDQSVPVDKLGNEFALVKGNGTIYQPTQPSYSQNMERAFIVATVNNTNIYVNNEPTPVNPTPLNAGQHFLVPSEKYIDQGNGRRNMYIKSTENVYVFQLLAGTDGSNGTTQIATGGYNYIPPLSCYLPKKIEELGLISENEGYRGGIRYLDTPTKLNIITEKGATVQVQRNGVNFPLTALDGPYNLSGTNNWVTYSIERSSTTGTNSVSGNMSVFSSKAVTAGISAGDGAVGYGGYFAGFSYIPAIGKTEGDCLVPIGNSWGGVKLEVTAGFDNYQWYERDLAGNPTPIPGANTNVFYPNHVGIYFVELQTGSCSPVTTIDYPFLNCTTYTNTDINSCGNEVITPTLALSAQPLNPASVKITIPPTKGTATIDPTTGKITYTANANASGVDYFDYSFCGIGSIPHCETARATIHMIEKRDDAVLQQCSTNGVATYDLSTANVSPDGTLTKTYFTTQNGAQNNIAANQILNFTNYTSADGFIYVRLVNSMNCVSVAKVELKSKLAPEVKETLYTKLHCDEDIDGKIDGVYKVDLSTITPIVLVQPSNFVVKYYATSAFATANGTNNLTGIFSFTADTSVWIRVDAPNGCPTTIKEIQLKTGTKFTVATPQSKIVCDNDHNNTENVDLSTMTSLFTTDAAATVKYFATLQAAQNNTPSIVPTQTITGDKTFYYRFTKAGFCDEIGVLNLQFKQGTPTALHDSYTVCQGSTITLNAETTYTSWLWQSGSTTVSTSNTATLGLGVYKVSFTDGDGCIFTKNITIVESPKPIWNLAAFNGALCDSNFDGIINVNLNQVTPVILGNPTLFTVRYYLNPGDAAVGNNNYIQNPATWSYTANTKVYVYAVSQYCPADVKQIEFKFGNNIPLLSNNETVTVCDNDRNGTENITLNTYKSRFTNDNAVSLKYYMSQHDAENNIGPVSSAQTLTGDQVFYIRFSKTGFCDVIGKLNVSFQVPRKSDLLIDKPICPGTTTTLDAGGGFDGYLWSTGATSQTVTVPVGDYWVELKTGTCVYKQHVSVTAFDLPVITSVEIQGTTVTVQVSGGNPPYQYAMDNNNYQSSNVFTNVRGGDHTIYVISADNCAPVSTNINVIELYNVITPNGDGVNDILDYSGLLKKEDSFLQIFDRYGKLLFTGNKSNNYIWDGRAFGKELSTGSYWYVMKWREPGTPTVNQYSGWILVKNRE